MRTRARHRLAVAAALAGAAACRGEQAEPGPVRNAVLVTLDTTRADALTAYGGQFEVAPELARLAAESLRYEWCRTVAPITAPAHASMLTGLYPPRHRVRDNGAGALPQAAVTLAELCAEAGIETAAFVAALVLDRELGLDQGFALYDQPARPERRQTGFYVERPAREVVDAALGWLARRPDPGRRFFLWVHLFDPHAPWEPPPELAALAAPAGERAPYLAEIAGMDRELGRLIAGLRAGGVLERTALIVLADHGEDLGDHGEPHHAALVYDTVLRVPLFVRYPGGYRAGESTGEIASVVDVLPTLCAALGLEAPQGIDGVSLWRRAAAADRGVYFESYAGYLSYGWAPLAGWADARGKYIHGAEPELYDPRSDPLERASRAAPAAELARYRQALAQVAARPALEPDPSHAGPSDARLEELALLGYASAAPRAGELPPPLEPCALPAPASRMEELALFLEAQRLMEERDLRAAVRVLERIVAENPRHVAALDRLGLCFVLVQGWPEAIEILEQRLALAEGPGSTRVNLALAYEHTGRLEEARAELERALELSPSSATAREALERVRAKLAEARGGG